MDKLINIEDFIAHLRDNNLVIVSHDVLCKNNMMNDLIKKQEMLLKRPSLTLKEIIDNKILKYKSKEGINYLIKKKIIKDGESWVDSKGVRRIITSAVKRLREYGY